ncbi:MAG: hydrolase [Spirochaetes bacterium]|nr:hydrolase [Spirochaetota bacterium]
MIDSDRRGALSEEEKGKPYAQYFYRNLAPVPDEILRKINGGPIDPRNALLFHEINRLLEPGYLPDETGYCVMADNSCYVSVFTDMDGVTGDMLDWWFCWHALEPLRYKIWYPGAHMGITVKDRKRLEDASLPYRERYRNNPQYPVEDVGVGPDVLSITFVPPRDFGFDESRFREARVATVICAIVGSVTKKARHTRMCHFVRESGKGVEMRSRFWIGGNLKLDWLPERSPVSRLINSRLIRKLMIPRDTGRQMAFHCAQEYKNLASILPDLYRDYGSEVR